MTGAGVVDLIITDLGVFEVPEKGRDGDLRLLEMAPDSKHGRITREDRGVVPAVQQLMAPARLQNPNSSTSVASSLKRASCRTDASLA